MTNLCGAQGHPGEASLEVERRFPRCRSSDSRPFWTSSCPSLTRQIPRTGWRRAACSGMCGTNTGGPGCSTEQVFFLFLFNSLGQGLGIQRQMRHAPVLSVHSLFQGMNFAYRSLPASQWAESREKDLSILSKALPDGQRAPVDQRGCCPASPAPLL